MFLLKHTEVTTVSLPAFLRALHKEPQWPTPIMQQKLGGSSLCARLIFHSQECSCLWGGTAVPAACPALWCHISKQEGKMQLLLWEYSQDFGAKNAALQCQEPCQDLKKLMVRCCAIALNFSLVSAENCFLWFSLLSLSESRHSFGFTHIGKLTPPWMQLVCFKAGRM